MEPGQSPVARLREALRDAPDARRFVIHTDAGVNDPPPPEGRVADAVTVIGIPLSDTCKEVVDGLVRRTFPRESLTLAHGPWVFSREALVEALARIGGREAEIPDMAGFCESAQIRVRVLPGQ